MRIIVKPVITEKMSESSEKMGNYAFVVNPKANKLEIEGLLKFKLNVQDKHKDNFEKAIKEKSVIFRSFGFNTTDTPGMEYAVFEIVKPDVNKTRKFLEVI